jgi:MFS family permease
LPFSGNVVLLIGGVFADRLSRRRVMIVADLARFAGQATMAALLISGHARIWELAALQALHGVATAAFSPASIGLIPSLTTSDRLQQANALRGLAMSAGNIAGPAIAGILVTATSPGWAIAVDAASFAASATMLSRLRVPQRRRAAAQPFLRDLLDGWNEFRSRSWVWMIVAFGAATNMLFAVFLVLGPVIARDSLGGPAAWATIIAAFGAGSVAGGMVTLHVTPRRPLRAGMLAIAFFPLPMFGLAAGLPTLGVAALGLFSGVGLTVFNALWETALQQGVPDRALSRVSAYDWFGSLACQPIGQAGTGFVASAIGVNPALWLAGSVQLLITLATLAVPAVRARPAAGDTPPATALVAEEG